MSFLAQSTEEEVFEVRAGPPQPGGGGLTAPGGVRTTPQPTSPCAKPIPTEYLGHRVMEICSTGKHHFFSKRAFGHGTTSEVPQGVEEGRGN